MNLYLLLFDRLKDFILTQVEIILIASALRKKCCRDLRFVAFHFYNDETIRKSLLRINLLNAIVTSSIVTSGGRTVDFFKTLMIFPHITFTLDCTNLVS